MQGLNSSDGDSPNLTYQAARTGSQATYETEVSDRRTRVDRRRTRNRVFEARARNLGMAIDRRRSRGWAANLIALCTGFLRARGADTAEAAEGSQH